MQRRAPLRIPTATTLLFLFLAAFGLPGTAAAATWTRLQSDHFVFVGDASEHDIRQIAQKIEQFRDVLHRAFPGSPADSPVPTIVYVFSNENVMAPFRPAFQGKPVEAAGYFIGADEANYIVLSAEREQDALEVVFHELTHAMTENTVGALPTWLNEGLAAFYETAEEGAGHSMTVGKFPPGYIALARPMTMSIDELLAVSGASRVYNESGGNRRSVFYAESWALTHYLTLGSSVRRDQLADYLSRIQMGTASTVAFHEAFQTDSKTLEKELRDYVSRTNFPVTRLSSDPNIGKAATAHGERLADREARAYLGDVLAHIDGRADDARAYLRKLLDEDGGLPRALASLGMLEIRSDHARDGVPLLTRAAAAAPDDGRIQGELGAALVQKLGAEPGAADYDATLSDARKALTRAAALLPGAANVLSNAGYVAMLKDGDLQAARTLLAQAIHAAPAREPYRLLLAQVLIRQREFDQATTILGPLVARGDSPAIRDRARRVLAQLADARARSMTSAASASGGPDSSVVPLPPNPAGGSSAPPPAGPPVFRPILRTMEPGESRVLGRLESVECANGSITLVIDTDAGTVRMAAAAFADIQFITYRSETPSGVACGAMPGTPRVLATYRRASAASGANGQAVAIELLPDGYTPRP